MVYNVQTMNEPNAQQGAPKGVFLATTVVMFVLALSAAESVGFVPYYVDGSSPTHERVALSSIPQLGDDVSSLGVVPTRIMIPTIDLDVQIQNPQTKEPAALDALLSAGPVRYPDSALLGEGGTIFIFAHSSHLPIVHNKMYQVFNRISELSVGDTMTLSGGERSDTYRVTSVRRTDASEEMIDIAAGGPGRLVLSTCDNFGAKTARYVVEAEIVGF